MICNFCYRKYKRSNSGWFLTEHPDLKTIRFYENLPDEVVEVYIMQTSFEEQVLQLFFDGASRTGPEGNIVAGVKAVLVLPKNYVISRAFSLTESCSNNVMEYNAL